MTIRIIKHNRKIAIKLIMLFFVFSSVYAQEKVELSGSDKKKIEKANKEYEKSAKLFQEADKMYADVVSRSADLTIEESDKLNNKAVLKQIEAEKIQFSAIKARYDVYAARVELFWIRFPGSMDRLTYARSLESSAKSEYISALELSRESESISDNLMKLSKIHDANEFIDKAETKMKQAFDECANPSSQQAYETPEPVNTEPAIEESSADTTYVAETYSEALPTETPNESYQTTVEPYQSEAASNITEAETTTSEPEAVYSEPETEPVTYTEETYTPATVESAEVATKQVPEQSYYQAPEHTKEYKPESSNISSYGTFGVQIAASRVPLTLEQIEEIYNGIEKIEENIINAWYKYSIGPFSDYESAAEFRDHCGVKGAFVIRK